MLDNGNFFNSRFQFLDSITPEDNNLMSFRIFNTHFIAFNIDYYFTNESLYDKLVEKVQKIDENIENWIFLSHWPLICFDPIVGKECDVN